MITIGDRRMVGFSEGAWRYRNCPYDKETVREFERRGIKFVDEDGCEIHTREYIQQLEEAERRAVNGEYNDGCRRR